MKNLKNQELVDVWNDFKEQIKLKAYLMKTIDLLTKTSIKTAFPKVATLSDIITNMF